MAYNSNKSRAVNHFNLAQPPQFQNQLHNYGEQSIPTTQNVQQQYHNDSNMSDLSDTVEKPAWMKSKLAGVKKVTNKERRRRQNQHLRRLLTPKNAVMVINEMIPKEDIAKQFKVEANANKYYKQANQTFCATLTIEGNEYKGFGENKLVARSNAAEQAVRDIIIKKIKKCAETGAESEGDEEALPMIQLASFALHKLFSEWEGEGYKVPILRPAANGTEQESSSTSSPAPPTPVKKVKELPKNASSMHPCMLLAYMRPSQDYRELGAEGDRPQTMQFTVGLVIDGQTYIGKACNKREARKLAARGACEAMFGVHFTDNPTDNAPLR